MFLFNWYAVYYVLNRTLTVLTVSTPSLFVFIHVVFNGHSVKIAHLLTFDPIGI